MPVAVVGAARGGAVGRAPLALEHESRQPVALGRRGAQRSSCRRIQRERELPFLPRLEGGRLHYVAAGGQRARLKEAHAAAEAARAPARRTFRPARAALGLRVRLANQLEADRVRGRCRRLVHQLELNVGRGRVESEIESGILDAPI